MRSRRSIRPAAITGLLLLVSLQPSPSFFGAGQPTALADVLPLGDSRASSLQVTTASRYLEMYCFDCHGKEDGSNESDVNVRNITNKNAEVNAELLSAVLDVISKREMPPQDRSQPTEEERGKMISSLKGMLAHLVESNGVRGETPIRRMNRFQYNNAVVDLFNLNCIVFTLPERAMRDHRNYFQPASGVMPDVVSVGNRPLGKSQLIEPRLGGVAAFPQDPRAEHGYDNQADHLSMSPLLMEAFLKLGKSVTESPDFNSKRVGIWNEFFKTPAEPFGEPNQLRDALASRLEPFLRRAFRGRSNAEMVKRYVAFAEHEVSRSGDFSAAMRSTASAIIASPRFYYLYTPQAVTEVELERSRLENGLQVATRLAMFLWGSIPDVALLDAAERGELLTEQGIQQQTDRMLRDRKLKRFCDSFPSQWLQLERIISSIPDPQQYPKFYFSKYRDSMHMMLEPLLLFETVLIENRSVMELIDPTFSYRSNLLEDAYGELATVEHGGQAGGGVTALQFKRVPISDRRTGGVITNAAVMTMTSGPSRTQPITRGAWVAGVIFNDPPKPPPADVPPLEDDQQAENESLTLRERLDLHRERADCRGCHEQIDPLGFALENYDAVGRWRLKYANERQIDASGILFNKHEFDDVAGFKDAILKERKRFIEGFTAHLLTYALARELTVADRLVVQRITSSSDQTSFRLQELISAIIQSEPFLDFGVLD